MKMNLIADRMLEEYGRICKDFPKFQRIPRVEIFKKLQGLQSIQGFRGYENLK